MKRIIRVAMPLVLTGFFAYTSFYNLDRSSPIAFGVYGVLMLVFGWMTFRAYTGKRTKVEKWVTIGLLGLALFFVVAPFILLKLADVAKHYGV